MEAEPRGGFHYMRYVMASLSSGAFVLLSMLQEEEREAQWRLNNLTSPRVAHCITVVLTIVALTLTGMFFKKLSAKWTMVTVMVMHVVHAFLYIHVHDYRFYWWIAVHTQVIRVIGLAVCTISMHSMISQWSPPNERSVITSIVYSGIALAAAYPGGLYAKSAIDILMALAVVWIVLWCVLIDDSPEQQKRLVSQEEKDHIRTSIENYWPRPDLKDDTSIRSVISSRAFLVVILIECSNTLIQSAISTRLLSVQFEEESIGFIGAAIVVLGTGIATTVLLQRKIISFDLSRKIPSIIAIAIPVPLMIMSCILRLYGARRVTSIVTHIVIGAKFSGAIVNIIDISPNYAPLLMAIVQVINQVLMLITYLLSECWNVYPYALHDAIVATPITVLAVVAGVLYWRWGSTAQTTIVANVFDPAAGKDYTIPYGPLPDEVFGPIKA